jgi:hypothetical protein
VNSVATKRGWYPSVAQCCSAAVGRFGLVARCHGNHCSGRTIMCLLAASRDQEQERVSSVAALMASGHAVLFSGCKFRITICNKLTTTLADNHVLAVSRGQEQERVSSAVQHVNQLLAVSAVCCLDRPESDWTVCIDQKELTTSLIAQWPVCGPKLL